MKERTWQSASYRYGFNGKENDTVWDVQVYGFRIYKPELGKFLSVDPLSASYPWYTPYQFAGNSPIYNLDLDGGEPLPYPITREYRAIYDSQTFTLVLIQPTSDEIKAINNATGVYIAAHGVPLYLKTSQKNALKETQISFGASTASGCETSLYYPTKKGPPDYGSVEYQSWIAKRINPETTINLLILNTKQDVKNAGIHPSDTDYYTRGNNTQFNTIIWNTDREAEFASYTNGFVRAIYDYNGNNLGIGTGLVTLNEINSWTLSPEGRDAILLDQHDAYFPSNTMKNAYEVANNDGKTAIISNIRKQLQTRDQSISSPAGSRYFRLSSGGATVVNEQQRKQQASKRVSVSAYGGVLPNH